MVLFSVLLYPDSCFHNLLSCQLLNGKQNQLPIPVRRLLPSRRYKQRRGCPVVSSYKIRLFLLMYVRWPLRYLHNWNSIRNVRISSLRSNVRPTWSSSTLFHWSILPLRKEAKLRGITVSKADPTLAMGATHNIQSVYTDRLSLTSIDFASKLHSLLLPHIPSFPPPTSRKTSNPATSRLPHSLNSNIRLYKYTALQHFGWVRSLAFRLSVSLK